MFDDGPPTNAVGLVSPSEATRQLGVRQQQWDVRQRTEAAERTAAAERDALLSRQERERLTPDAAAAKLAERMADPEWRDRYLGGDIEARREAAALIEDKSAGSEIDSIMDGTALSRATALGPGFTTTDGGWGVYADVGTVGALREIGVDDGSIRHALEGNEVTQAEHSAAKLARARLMSNSEWTARYTSGDLDARATMTRLNIIIASPIKAAA